MAPRNRTQAPSNPDREVAAVRGAILKAQLAARQAGLPVVILVGGVGGAGKGELVQRLNEWLDPRGVDTHAFWRPEKDARGRPAHWPFWQALPERGRIAIFFGSWYWPPIRQRAGGALKKAAFREALGRIAFLERMLAQDGMVLVKLWLHLSKKAQRHRLERLESKESTRWQVTAEDWDSHKHYEPLKRASDTAVSMTDHPWAPWHIIEAKKPLERDLTAGRILIDALAKAAKPPRKTASKQGSPSNFSSLPIAPSPTMSQAPTLASLAMDSTVDEQDYVRQLSELQGRLGRLAWKAFDKGVATVLVFEGWDAAGKGSAIRRVTNAIDPRLYKVVPIAAPTQEEKAHHYLWRFWRRLNPRGSLTIFDRSWYGRVLVERVEGFARPDEWRRAYLELVDFEQQIVASGAVLLKFWLQITPEEQLRRFRERARIEYKRHKITEEDWRNRAKWPKYEEAVDEMVLRTHARNAPWALVPANDKRFARLKILSELCGGLDRAIHA